MNGIQEVSGSIPLISTRTEKSLGTSASKAFLVTRIKLDRVGPVAQLGERSVRIREVESSNLFRSTRWTLDEHLLFQRRLCCDGVALMSNEQRRSRYKPWPPLFCRFISFCLGHPATPQTPVGPVHCHSISVSPGRENGQKFL